MREGARGYKAVEFGIDGQVSEADLPDSRGFVSSGRRALLSRDDGTMLETNDCARTWTAVAPPPGGVSMATLLTGSPRGWIAECSELGCSFYDGMVRVGWEL
jgi:hypothetical protein